MKEILNANNLIKGDRIKKIETTYDFSGKIMNIFENELIVKRVNKNTVTVEDITFNMEYKLLKNYEFGKVNCGIKNEYYLI